MNASRIRCRAGRRTLTSALLALVLAAPADAARRRAFVTSIAGSGMISTWPGATGATVLDKADSVCRSLAAAAEPAALPNAGTYRAWLSTDSTDAWCHVQGLSGKKATNCGGNPPGAGPWFLSNGATNFSGTLDELVDEGKLFRSVSRDENFDAIPINDRSYWTGTDLAGVGTGENCDNWSDDTPGDFLGTTGDAYRTAGYWSRADEIACAGDHRLLCLEPGAGETATLGWSAAALVFLTSTTVTGKLSTAPEAQGEEGIAAGDRICRRLAEQAYLPAPGSFVAWLSGATPIVDAADRVVVNGRFKRIDAYTVANTRADLLDGTLDLSIHQFEDGTYLHDDCAGFTACLVWTGTIGDGTGDSFTCDDWTEGAGTFLCRNGRAADAALDSSWTSTGMTSSNVPHRLYCVSNVVTIFWDGFELTGDPSRWSAHAP